MQGAAHQFMTLPLYTELEVSVGMWLGFYQY